MDHNFVPQKKWRESLIFIAKICVSAILIFLAFREVDLERLRTILFGIDRSALFLSVFVMASSWLINSARWSILLKICGIATGTIKLFSYNLISFFYSTVLPGGKVTGDLVKAYRITVDHNGNGAEKQKVFVSVFLDRIFGLLAYLFIVGLYLVFDRAIVPTGVAAGELAIVSILIAGATLLLSGRAGFLPDFITRTITIYAAMFSAGWRRALGAFGLSLFGLILTSLSVFIISNNLDLAVDFWTINFFYALAVILSMIPITIAGIGLREGGLIYLLTWHGVNDEGAAALSIATFFVIMILSLAGGAIEFYYHFLMDKRINVEKDL